MSMLEFVRTVKRGLNTTYGFTPDRVTGAPPYEDYCYDNIPDGHYPLTIDGREYGVELRNNTFHFLNPEAEARRQTAELIADRRCA